MTVARFDFIHTYDPEVIELMRGRRFIPLDAFAYWWRHGDLDKEIERRAPLSTFPNS